MVLSQLFEDRICDLERSRGSCVLEGGWGGGGDTGLGLWQVEAEVGKVNVFGKCSVYSLSPASGAEAWPRT